VKPTRSAKTIVATLRSRPDSGAAPVWAEGPVGAADVAVAWLAISGAAVPQDGQKRPSAGSVAPQAAQARSVGVPQAGQKRVPGSSARPQDRQSTPAS
jgi:hypothetical protein